MRRANNLRSLLAWIVTPALVILGVSLGVGSPAHAVSPPPISVPIKLLPLDTGFRPTVEIRLPGMTSNVTVSLDTGSSGLVILADKIPGASPVSTGQSATMSYASCDDVSGVVAHDEIDLMDGDTVAYSVPDVKFVNVTHVGCPDGTWTSPASVVGTLGVGQGANLFGSEVTASPFTFDTVHPVYGQYTKIHLDSKTLEGVLTIGNGDAIEGGTVFHAKEQSAVYHNTHRAHYHMVYDACWEIFGKSDCHDPARDDTTFDTGAPGGFAGARTWEHEVASGDLFPLGTEIKLLKQTGSEQQFFDRIVVSEPSMAIDYRPGKRSYNPDFEYTNNSGSGFLLDRDLLLNFDDGTVTIGPNQRPISGITLGIAIGDRVADASVKIAEQGLKKGSAYTLTMHSRETLLTRGTTNGLGRVFSDSRLPAHVDEGWHRLTLVSTSPRGKQVEDNFWFEVSADGRLLSISRELPNTGASVAPSAVVGLGAGLIGLGLVALATVGLIRRRRKTL